ncbi:metallo-beta-lactamase [Lucifera butyrica]|uniref:Metallo-beta-lactamase n=1 Tax=Lucifera butyrica TaxID=1351585 RepID=A0A498R5M7_9FIRM|nr:N-acyl homoserine lactonase family protein [Lucifera butyrica]VBB06701.1 metallo-beta-lactamase [Lucifera butyrica]
MKVYVLDNGWLECDANWMVGLSTVATLQNKECRHKWLKIPVYCVLIDHPEGKILFDLGCHPNAMKGYWPNGLVSIFPYYYNENQDLERQLALTGTKPGDIKTIILSHMHLDHAGNLYRFEHADVYVHRKDFEYGQTLVHLSPQPENHGAYVKADMEVAVKQFHLVDKDFELVPGVEIISLPGHTPGVLGVIVHLAKEGTLIFPQDAVYTRENYGPPVKASGIVHDSLAFFSSVEKVRNYARKYNAKVMFSHDMEFFKTMKHAPQYYE